MILNKDRILLIITGVSLLSFAISMIQGYIQVQLTYAVIIGGILIAIFILATYREVHETDWRRAYKTGQEVAQEIASFPKDTRVPLNFITHRKDANRFSTSGHVWDMQFRGNPAFMDVLLDAKSGKVVHIQPSAKSRESPVEMLPKSPEITLPTPSGKKETKLTEKTEFKP